MHMHTPSQLASWRSAKALPEPTLGPCGRAADVADYLAQA